MFSIFNTNERTTTESVDIIEKIVYEYLKPLGFKKYGRTLHRFVDGDISQVVNFQNGAPQKGVYDILWINLGIRVPECVERKFVLTEPLKKYYKEYECNIRTRLGSFIDHNDTSYNLKMDPYEIGSDIVKRIEEYVMPIFNTLSNRDAILRHRTEYKDFDSFNNHMILLEEAMIKGRRGDIAEATRLFNEYYAKCNYELEHGHQIYLIKGQKTVYYNNKTYKWETINPTENGLFTIYSSNKTHITYLERLAKELKIALF